MRCWRGQRHNSRDTPYLPLAGLGLRGRDVGLRKSRGPWSLSGEMCQKTMGFLGKGTACAKVQRWERTGWVLRGLDYKAERAIIMENETREFVGSRS